MGCSGAAGVLWDALAPALVYSGVWRCSFVIGGPLAVLWVLWRCSGAALAAPACCSGMIWGALALLWRCSGSSGVLLWRLGFGRCSGVILRALALLRRYSAVIWDALASPWVLWCCSGVIWAALALLLRELALVWGCSGAALA